VKIVGRRRIEELRKDAYYKLAKREGYRSRAVYKLIEINRVFNIIHKGDRVLDLGSAPGGWLQYIAEIVSIDGTVVGVDIRPIEPLGKSNVYTYQGDIFDDSLIMKIKERFGENRFDVITSDLSTNITGIWEVDVLRNLELNERVLEIADQLLKPGGNIVLKIFEGRGVGRLIAKVRKLFRVVKLYKPRASRKRSSEIYIIGIDYMPRKVSKKEL